MESSDEQLRQLTTLNIRSDDRYVRTGKVAALVDNLQQKASAALSDVHNKAKAAPFIPPKPLKKSIEMPQVPLSKLVTDTREPLYSQPLQSLEFSGNKGAASGSSLLRKQLIYSSQTGEKAGNSQTNLDNPAVLEQQLEALAYHKQQMEKKGLLGSQSQLTKQIPSIPKLSSTSLSGHAISNKITSLYSNLSSSTHGATNDSKAAFIHISTQPEDSIFYSNVQHTCPQNSILANANVGSKSLPRMLSICTNPLSEKELDEDLPPPPSPVSSSYSELRRASDVFNKAIDFQENSANKQSSPSISHTNYADHYSSHTPSLKSSSTYDSIYEPINPRPPSDISSRTNYNIYASYVNQSNIQSSSTSGDNGLLVTSGATTPLYCRGENGITNGIGYSKKNENIESTSQYNLTPINSASEMESYGRCYKCGDRVLGENSGCTAMDKIYHISCFTCTECQLNLQGKPFYALEGKPFCEYDYLQTLEKCSVCLKPILERILRATGKPYHPQCFTCVVCGNSLDAIPFTVDATNQNYCIADFHKKFAPRCCVCQEPIMPEPGQEETVRVVALDRSFHLECYKCEDCALLLSSEADGRGCYPLDDHVLCKSCNARRVQVLTNRMTSEL
ncbi:GH23971 [Drosophila grimshawi]|uniref:GH23971 n=1 Tax=Drosophila grimshawi TaxID=7222 RepID=B4JZN7_DROGR|nr:GH23971 [Drosophila grimshawi]